MEGLRLGLVTESFHPDVCEPDVIANGRRAAAALAACGAVVEEVSIPLWTYGMAVFQPYMAHLFSDVYRDGGQGFGHLGAYDVPAFEAFTRIRLEEGALLPDQVKAWILADRHVHERYGGHPVCAAAQRQARGAAGDQRRRSRAVDALLTPTLPITAPPLLTGEASFAEVSGRTARQALLQHDAAQSQRPSGHVGAERRQRGRSADRAAGRHRALRRVHRLPRRLCARAETGPFVPATAGA